MYIRDHVGDFGSGLLGASDWGREADVENSPGNDDSGSSSPGNDDKGTDASDD
ncbi:hypothetical protein ACOMICROBIO_LKFPLAJE_04399 [Vibrio sp. B1FIG11]|nr:hypothetical protein ACOMICROBIO_LKFPLAJE_04399 [Vibrio sp. B1FIG11]